MSYRICRQINTRTFQCKSGICKVFMEPCELIKQGHWSWNFGFAVGSSKRQLNDWYNNRNKKSVGKLKNKFTGKEGTTLLLKSFNLCFNMRWNIPPGDLIIVNCESGEPEKQFRVYKKLIRGKGKRNHLDWVIDEENKKFFWYRPPYPDDLIWESAKQNNVRIISAEVPNPLQDCLTSFAYFESFDIVQLNRSTHLPSG